MDNESIFSRNTFNGDNSSYLRPKNFNEYVGQNRIIENLKIYVEAAKKREEPLDHCLIYGPPGLGKTTLANVISNEMSVNIRITSGPVIEKPGDLAAILTNLSEGDILFIDEIHRLHPSVEEILYPAIEDFKLDLVIGQGPAARTIRIDLNKFTMIGATTRIGLITSPLRDRFGITLRLNFYEFEDLRKIVLKSAEKLGVKIDNDAALEIARRSRGTPRVANRILRRIRDFAQVLGNGDIDLTIAKKGLSKLDIDEEGLSSSDLIYLKTIIYKFNGGPVGIDTLTATIPEDKGTLEDVIEPYLLYKGMIKKTPRGRVAVDKSYKHLGLKIRGLYNNSIERYLE
ncbi:MAG: Holliday junction branch migration DNA helicase RuvB [Deferribacterota bacterium]|nr:Holliday junction branch migration DNA helicase RuvB [Deferribacterota bacterium]